MEKEFASGFFNENKSNETPSDHQEWLLREYSKLMHRECLVKKREEQISKKQEEESQNKN